MKTFISIVSLFFILSTQVFSQQTQTYEYRFTDHGTFSEMKTEATTRATEGWEVVSFDVTSRNISWSSTEKELESGRASKVQGNVYLRTFTNTETGATETFYLIMKKPLGTDVIFESLKLRIKAELDSFKVEINNSLRTIPTDLKAEYKEIYEKIIDNQTAIIKSELEQIKAKIDSAP